MKVRYYEKRPDAWHLDFRSPEGKRLRPYGGPTKAAAEKAAPAVIAAALTAVSVGPTSGTVKVSGPTLEDTFRTGLKTREQWIDSKDKGSLQTTFDNLFGPEAAAKLGFTQDSPVAILTRDFVRKLRELWLEERGKKKGTTLSRSTINHRLSMLSSLLEVADLAPHGVKHLSVKGTRRTRRVSDAEVLKMVDWCTENGHRRGALAMRDLIKLALACAAREGELLSLQWKDVAEPTDQRPATVTFRETKNGETRTVPLPPHSWTLLKARRGLPAPFSDTDQRQLVALWSDAREAIGLKDDEEFVFHALRHEAVSRLVETPGVSPFTVQAIAGHASIATTNIYVHASLEAMQRAISPAVTAPVVGPSLN